MADLIEALEEQARLVEERLRQRSAALGRVAAENEQLRAALLRVIARADVERDLGLVRAEDIHDAIGYELIQSLQSPKVQWRDPAPMTMATLADMLSEVAGVSRASLLQGYFDRMVISQPLVPLAFRRPTADEILGIDDE